MNENNNEVNNTVSNNTQPEVQPETLQTDSVQPTAEQAVQPVQQAQATPSQNTTSSSQPQVVKVVNTKEVVKEVSKGKEQKSSESKQEPPKEQPVQEVPQQTVVEEKTVKKKKGHPIFSAFIILSLFAFVFFLPQITSYVSAYMKAKNGGDDVDGSMKSGTMTCTLAQQFEDGSTTTDITFTYDTNKLKKTSTQTTYRLADTAIDNAALIEHQASCEHLREVLSGVEGMDASCNQTATVQTTVQDVNYQKLDLDYLNENIAEFEGFMPEYQLDKNVAAIKLSLEQTGYTCKAIEH